MKNARALKAFIGRICPILLELRHSRSSYRVIMKNGKRCASGAARGFASRTRVSTEKRWKGLTRAGARRGRASTQRPSTARAEQFLPGNYFRRRDRCRGGVRQERRRVAPGVSAAAALRAP